MRRWASNNHAQQDFDDYVQAFATIAAAAAAENLQVISPTVRKGTGEGQEAWWLAQFLGACNEDTTYSCDEDAIALFDLHNYNCKASKWGTDSNSFLVQMKDDLKTELAALAAAGRTDRSASEWATWVDARGIWVTETSCNWESNPPDNVGSCERNAEKHDAAWGTGSVIALDNSPMVSRWAWWTTFRV